MAMTAAIRQDEAQFGLRFHHAEIACIGQRLEAKGAVYG